MCLCPGVNGAISKTFSLYNLETKKIWEPNLNIVFGWQWPVRDMCRVGLQSGMSDPHCPKMGATYQSELAFRRMLTIRCLSLSVIGIVINYSCHTRENVLINCSWYRKSWGSWDALGYTPAVRYVRYHHLCPINKTPRFQEGKWLAQDHSARSLLVGGNEGERKKKTVCFMCHLYYLFLQREKGTTAINGYRIYTK